MSPGDHAWPDPATWLKDDDAARGVYPVIVHVPGAVALEAADVPHVGALPPEAERIAAREAAFAAVPPGVFPRTAAAAGIIATWVGSGQFVWGCVACSPVSSGPI